LHSCAGRVQENWGFFKLFLPQNSGENFTFGKIGEGKIPRCEIFISPLPKNLGGVPRQNQALRCQCGKTPVQGSTYDASVVKNPEARGNPKMNQPHHNFTTGARLFGYELRWQCGQTPKKLVSRCCRNPSNLYRSLHEAIFSQMSFQRPATRAVIFFQLSSGSS
jgi:hypothetical protein